MRVFVCIRESSCEGNLDGWEVVGIGYFVGVLQGWIRLLVEAINEHSAGSGDLRCLDVGLWILRMCAECADLVGVSFCLLWAYG